MEKPFPRVKYNLTITSYEHHLIQQSIDDRIEHLKTLSNIYDNGKSNTYERKYKKLQSIFNRLYKLEPIKGK